MLMASKHSIVLYIYAICIDRTFSNMTYNNNNRKIFYLFLGPLPKTSQDFWRMIWEQHCLVVVMTTRVMERGRVKCGQYWEPTENSSLEFGNFHVRTISIEINEDYTVASLELKNLKVRLIIVTNYIVVFFFFLNIYIFKPLSFNVFFGKISDQNANSRYFSYRIDLT